MKAVVAATNKTLSSFSTKKLLKAMELYEGDAVWYSENDGECSLFGGEGAKWYDHEIEMIESSKNHPDTVFVLDGMGEDSGDVWRKFYFNGRSLVWRPDDKKPELEPIIMDALTHDDATLPLGFDKS